MEYISRVKQFLKKIIFILGKVEEDLKSLKPLLLMTTTNFLLLNGKLSIKAED